MACTDPHFRPSHIHLDVDGSLLICDWYGRDDESDMTGRVWRLKSVGKEHPVVKHKLDSVEWKDDKYAVSALGSPDHMVRAKATAELWMRAKDRGPSLLAIASHAEKAKEPLGAANALWLLQRITPREIVDCGLLHPDWRVRRLAVNRMRREKMDVNDVQKMLTLFIKESGGFRSARRECHRLRRL